MIINPEMEVNAGPNASQELLLHVCLSLSLFPYSTLFFVVFFFAYPVIQVIKTRRGPCLDRAISRYQLFKRDTLHATLHERHNDFLLATMKLLVVQEAIKVS